jgi:hypothetical protein
MGVLIVVKRCKSKLGHHLGFGFGWPSLDPSSDQVGFAGDLLSWRFGLAAFGAEGHGCWVFGDHADS